MVRVLRWLGGGLLALLGLALAGLLAWAATQGPDAAPRPLPAALQRPADGPPSPLFQRMQALLAPDDAGPVEVPQQGPLACDRAADCATAWHRDIEAVAAQLQALGRLGERCEAVWALAGQDGPYVEWLPERLGPSHALPALHGLIACQRWLIGRLLVAAAAGDAGATAQRLQQSHAWALQSLHGARSLVGHQIAIRQGQAHLQAVAAVALLQPGWSAMLEAAVPPWPDDLLNPVRWMPVEAAFGRGAIDEVEAQCQAGAGPDSPAATAGPEPGAGALTRLTGLVCRHRIGWLPEATRQQLDALWLARIERLRDGPQAWLEASRQRREAGLPADERSPWAWRNTLGALWVMAGQDDALYDDYIASPADLALHRQWLAATLALRRAGVPPPEREAWLASAGLLPPEVLARARWEPDGRALRWQTWDADMRGDAALATPRTPSRIVLDPEP